MQISLSKFATFLTGLLIVIILAGTGYIFFTVFFGGEKVDDIPTIEKVNPSLFGPKAQKAATVLVNKSQQILLSDKDLLFTKGSIYNRFTDVPETVPLSDSRGRPDPFTPADSYVAP